MIGSGPFVLKSYQKGVQIAFERNPDYYMKGLPYLDGVVIEITPESSARLSLLRAGKVELGHMWGYAIPEEAKSLKQTNPEMVMSPTWVLPNGIIYFRTDQPPFNDVRVRRAIPLAIDRHGWNHAIHHVRRGQCGGDGVRPAPSWHRGRLRALRGFLPGAASKPQPHRRCRAEQDADRPAPGAGPQEAAGPRARDPALPGGQGLLRVPAGAAPVHRARPAGEGLHVPRRLLSRVPADVHLAGQVSLHEAV